MQEFGKAKADYKTRIMERPILLKQLLISWRWPFAIGLLTFALVWRIGAWWLTPSEMNPESRLSVAELHLQPEHKISLPALELVKVAPLHAIQALTEYPPDNILDPYSEAIQKIHFKIESGQSLAHYFQKYGIGSSELRAVLTSIKHDEYLKKIHPGQRIEIVLNEHNQIDSLTLLMDKIKSLHIKRISNQKFTSELVKKTVDSRIAYGSSTIRDSLYAAGKKAHLTDKLILELAKIFEFDIDYALDIQPGDSFKVLYEEQFVDGEKISNGPILAAEFITQRKKYQAFRYAFANGKTTYYNAKGEGLQKAFIRTPVEFTRISSHFSLTRKHPILHKIRAHKGVDYAAPQGTPVKASANGTVAFLGKKGGYGNAIILQHGPVYSTLYGHLSRFVSHLRTGQSVKQGQVIGYVGMTGLASGPHLHYEFRINGVHKDPLTVALPNSPGIPTKERDRFLKKTHEQLAMMARHERVNVAVSQSNQSVN